MAEEIGYKKPPSDTRFGGKRANKRNNKGRPTDVKLLRQLAQSIANENVEGSDLTVVEAMLRRWAESKSARLQIKFIVVAYGTEPSRMQTQSTHAAPIPIVIIKQNDNTNSG